MDPDGGFDAESALHALLSWPEVGSRLRHGDHLRAIHVIRAPIGDDRRGTLGEDVLHPIREIAIRKRDQEAVAVRDRDDGRLVGPARSTTDMTNDGGIRSGLTSRPEGERPRQSRETA